MSRWRVELGDCLGLLRALPAASVDALVTDPPAGIGFMGSEWDRFDSREAFVAFLTPILAECLRVLKPGAHALVWALPKTSHWTGWAVESAGFEVRDVISAMWGVGFPKSLDISKAIDKQRDDRAAILGVTTAIADARDRAGLTNAAIDAVFGYNGMAGHWTTRAKQPGIPTLEQWAKLRELLPELVSIEPEILRLNQRKGQPGEAWETREVIGEHGNPASAIYGDDKPRSVLLTAPASEESKRWVGWGSALKPSQENWILARKPLEGTIVDNVRRYGTGALNINATRIGTEVGGWQGGKGGNFIGRAQTGPAWPTVGRWPGNLVFAHLPTCELDGSKDVRAGTACEPDGKSMRTIYGEIGSLGREVGYGENGTERVERYACAPGCPVAELERQGGDGCSRFFYTVKPSTEERTAGLGEDELHPTMKPVALMRWLVRMITPPDGTVLDPFTGSGTTGIAALLEGFEFIGFEREPKFVAIAKDRIKHWERHGERAVDAHRSSKARAEVEAAGQISLFGEK